MIIIKTPQPDTEERLVLVPPESVSRSVEGVSQPGACDLAVHTNNARDATPDDLARGGYVVQATMAGHLRVKNELADALARAEKAEGLLVQRETELRLAREDGAAVERQMREARSAADASFVRANRAEMRAEKAEREREEAKELARVLEVERDEAKAGHNAVQPRVYALEADLAETVHERDALRAELARLTAPGEGSEGEPTDEELLATANAAWAANMSTAADARRALFRAGVAHKRARQQPAKDRATDEARPLREVSAELEAMRTTHDERDRVYVGAIASDDELVTVYRRAAEPLGDEHGVSLRDLVRRCQARGVLAVAARVRQERCLVAQAVGMGASLDEELFGAYQRAFVRAADEEDDIEEEPDPERLKVERVTPEERAGILAVAARVRQERCLVAQAVARGWYIYLCPQKNDPSKWDIEAGRVIAGRSDGGAMLHGVPASDVPATLARLLGEVEK